jgi:hypothetical protein
MAAPSTLTPSLDVDPATGRVTVPPAAGTLTDITPIAARGHVHLHLPIPVHCQRHAAWHGLPGHWLCTQAVPLTLDSNWTYNLGVAALTILAHTWEEAERTTAAHRAAWTDSLARIRDRIATETDDFPAALLDATCLIAEALERATGLPLHEALRPLADARFPDDSDPIWNALGPEENHALPRPADGCRPPNPSAILRVPTLVYLSRPRLAVLDAATVLAARMACTCDEALLRISIFRTIWKSPPPSCELHPRGPNAAPISVIRLSALVYRALAAALRAATLPGPDFALLALEMGLSA